MLATILVPLDGSPLAERVLPHATALAHATGHGARIVLIRAVQAHTSLGTDPEPAQLAATERAEAELEAIAEQVRAYGFTVEPHISYDEAAPAILDIANRQQADLIVMSTHGRSGLGRWVYGSVADEVLRKATVPTFLVPAGAAGPRQRNERARVLVPLDGSDLAAEALATAELFAELFGADLSLLRVVEPYNYPIAGDAYAYIPFDEEGGLVEARNYLESVAERLQTSGHLPSDGRAIEISTAVGQPAAEITRLAREKDIDVIAMATHGRGGVARLVMGSTATGALHLSGVPLLLTRPAAARQPAPAPHAEPIVVTLTPNELLLAREGVELLLNTARHEEKLAGPLHGLLEKLGRAESAETSKQTLTVI